MNRFGARGLAGWTLVLAAGCAHRTGATSADRPQAPPQERRQPEPPSSRRDRPTASFLDALAANATRRWAELAPTERARWERLVLHEGEIAPPPPPAGPADPPAGPSGAAESDPTAVTRGARRAALERTLERVLAAIGWSGIRVEARAAVRDRLAALGQAPPEEHGPPGRHPVAIAHEELLLFAALEALGAARWLGQQEFVLAVPSARTWYLGDGLADDEQVRVGRTLVASCKDVLHRARLRQAPASSDRQRVEQAALQLGASPTTASLQSFADMFRADWVISIDGAIRFEAPPPGASWRGGPHGWLRVEGLRARVYSRRLDLVLVELPLLANDRLREPRGPLARELHAPWVPRDAALAGVVEAYARDVGAFLGRELALRLLHVLRPDDG